MSETLLPGGIFRNRVQGGEAPESWSRQSHLIEEIERRSGETKEAGVYGSEYQRTGNLVEKKVQKSVHRSLESMADYTGGENAMRLDYSGAELYAT